MCYDHRMASLLFDCARWLVVLHVRPLPAARSSTVRRFLVAAATALPGSSSDGAAAALSGLIPAAPVLGLLLALDGGALLATSKVVPDPRRFLAPLVVGTQQFKGRSH